MADSEFSITTNNSLYGLKVTVSSHPIMSNSSQNFNNHRICCDIETTTSSDEFDDRYDGLIALSTFIILLSITTVLSNGLVIHVLRTDRTLHTVSNYFALSLTMSDLLVGLIVIPLNLLHLHAPRDWDSYMVLRGIWVTLDFILTTSSILNLVLLNLDRFWSITSPIKYIRQRTKRNALCLIGIVWGISTILTLVPAAVWPYVFKDIVIPAKTEFIFFGKSAWLMGSVSICVFFIPLIILCAIYSRIFKAIHSRSKLDLGRASVANSMPKKGSELQQGLINEQQLQRLQVIYDKAVKRERGERQISALKKKLKNQYNTGAKRIQRYESINEEREGSNNSLRNSEKGSLGKGKPGGGMQIPTLLVERTSSSNSLEKRSPTKDFLTVAWNKGQWLGRQRVASVDMIRDRGNSFCSDTTSSRPKQILYNTSRSCEILPVGPGLSKSDSRHSLPANRRTSPSGSPKISSSRASVDNYSSSNYLQIFAGDGNAKCNNILRSHSSPGLSKGNSNHQIPTSDEESFMTAGEVSIAVPVLPGCNCPRMRTLSTESSSPPTSPKDIAETEDARSLLLPSKPPPTPRGSIFRERLHSHSSHNLRRTSFSAEMLTRPSSDSGYCSEAGFRPPSASYPQHRQASLSVPENINAIKERVRNSFSNSFSLISGQGSKALTLLKKQDKAARQLGVILTCLVTCWTPYFVLILLYCFRPELGNVTGMSVAVYLGYIHSLCNPILFTLFNLRFQRSFKRVLCPCTPLEDIPRPCSVPPPSMI